jgi:hypothetical protein
MKRRHDLIVCTFPYCKREHYARGLCATHYARLRRGKIKGPLPPKMGEHDEISICCGTTCTVGDMGTIGNRYCDDCKRNCYWKRCYPYNYA